MKTPKFLIAAFVAAGLAGSANAQTVINITGATAFRQAAHQAILSSLTSVTYGYTSTNINNASSAIFKGTLGNAPVTVRTTWSGSVAGVRAIVNQNNSVSYIAANATVTGGNGTASMTATESTTANRIAFADNTQSNTPFNAVALSGTPVGAIVFVPVTNEGSPLAGVTQDGIQTGAASITTLQLRALQTTGSTQLQLISGNTNDNGKFAYWTGRNSLSGTRAIYLAESGVGAGNAVQQYLPQPWNTNSTISGLKLWPTSDANNANNTINVWGPVVAGGGGFDSGGVAARAFQATMNATNVNIIDEADEVLGGLPGASLALVSVISAQDAEDVQVGGGEVLAYNGVYIEPRSLALGGLNATDKLKVANGQYTLWSNEYLYYRPSGLNAEELALVAALEANVPPNIGGNGLRLDTEMNVSRSADGGSLTIGNIP